MIQYLDLMYSRISSQGSILSRRIIQIIRRTYPILYFPLADTYGTAAVTYGTVAGADGVHYNTVLQQLRAPGNTPSPYFNGTDARVKVYSDAIKDVFGSVGSYSMMMCYRIYDPAEWSSGILDYLLHLGCAGSQYIRSYTDTVVLGRMINRVSSVYGYVNPGLSGWNTLCVTDVVGGDLKIYSNNVAITTSTGRGWTPPMSSTNAAIGANYAHTPSGNFHGYFAHLILWNIEISTYTRTWLHNKLMSVGNLGDQVDFHGTPSVIYVAP